MNSEAFREQVNTNVGKLTKSEMTNRAAPIVRHSGFDYSFVIRHSWLRHFNPNARNSSTIPAAIASLRRCYNLAACHSISLNFRLK